MPRQFVALVLAGEVRASALCEKRKLFLRNTPGAVWSIASAHCTPEASGTSSSVIVVRYSLRHMRLAPFNEDFYMPPGTCAWLIQKTCTLAPGESAPTAWCDAPRVVETVRPTCPTTGQVRQASPSRRPS